MFEVKITESANEDLRWFRKYEQTRILDGIETQLLLEPARETKKRKQLRLNDLTKWELRLEKYRVFYDVDIETKIVKVKAVGWKEHNRLFIRGKEFFL